MYTTMVAAASLELRLTYWRASVASWLLIAATIAVLVFWPPDTWSPFQLLLLSAYLVALLLYPFWFVKKTRVTIEGGWLRVNDLIWPDQAIPVASVIGIRRTPDRYWEAYSLSGQKVRIRPLWRRAKMNELARVLNVPIKGWGDDWIYHTDLNLDARIAFTRWLRARKKLMTKLNTTRSAPPEMSYIPEILELRRRETQLWQAFLDADKGDEK